MRNGSRQVAFGGVEIHSSVSKRSSCMRLFVTACLAVVRAGDQNGPVVSVRRSRVSWLGTLGDALATPSRDQTTPECVDTHYGSPLWSPTASWLRGPLSQSMKSCIYSGGPGHVADVHHAETIPAAVSNVKTFQRGWQSGGGTFVIGSSD